VIMAPAKTLPELVEHGTMRTVIERRPITIRMSNVDQNVYLPGRDRCDNWVYLLSPRKLDALTAAKRTDVAEQPSEGKAPHVDGASIDGCTPTTPRATTKREPMLHAARVLAARDDVALDDLIRAIVPFMSRKKGLLLCMLIRSMLRGDLKLSRAQFEQHVAGVLGESTALLQEFSAAVTTARARAKAFRRSTRRHGVDSKLTHRLEIAKRRLAGRVRWPAMA